jgi:DNA invertase Pin-like site-specific DNA recombinase
VGNCCCHLNDRLPDINKNLFLHNSCQKCRVAATMLTGYMRISKADGSQISDLQRGALLKNGCEARPRLRGPGLKRDARPGLEACLKALRAGDTLVVWKLDRLGRGLPHLVNTVHGLVERKVGFRVLTGQGRISIPARRVDAWRSASSLHLQNLSVS